MNNKNRDTQQNDLLEFAINSTTKTQKRKILEINDIETLILFLTSAYNCYKVMRNKVNIQMITNPNDLFFSKKEQQDFIKIIKNHILEELYHNTYKITNKDE
ncbi:MAG: hypothetical protein IKU15_09225 [Clostridia bacterium]|nr:hypothetical protein [Clostridia bacterium]